MKLSAKQKSIKNLKEELLLKILRSKLDKYKNKYDVVDPSNSKKRRKMQPETQEEHDILRPYDRLRVINLARDLERNFTSAKALIRQLKINVVGNLGKARFNTGDKEKDKLAANWFNGVWAKHCDSRGDLHFCEILQLVLSAVIREGDILVAFDDFDRDDGKLLLWEADQLVSISDASWQTQTRYPAKDYGQESGVIYDKRGRIVAYAVTGKRGYGTVNFDDATILPRGVTKLLMNPFRPNMLRGVGDFLAASADMEDIYEMRAKELQTAKVAATFAGVVKKEDGIEESLMRGGIAPEALLATPDGTPESSATKDNYDALETLTGGLLEYMDKGDSFEFLNVNRPQVAFKDFFDFVLQCAGASFGISKSYATLTPAGSYTAFRGDMLLAWQTFKSWQKFLERHLCDWAAVKAVNFAIEKKELPSMPEAWENKISWLWPEMPQVDPQAETNAIREKLRLGITSYAELLGAGWQDRLSAFADEIKFIRATEGLDHLSIFETVAGAPIEQKDETKQEES